MNGAEPGKGTPWAEAWKFYLRGSSRGQVWARARVGGGAREGVEAACLETGWAWGWGRALGREGSCRRWALGCGGWMCAEWHL